MEIQPNRQNVYNNSFHGLKQDKILVETALKEFQDEYQYLKSNSFVNSKIIQHSDNAVYRNIIVQLRKLNEVYSEQSTRNRNWVRSNMSNMFDSDAYPLLRFITKFTSIANCGEQNHIFKVNLERKGLKPKVVVMTTYSGKTQKPVKGKDHTFLVLNLAPNAKIESPSTWGSRAIIADAWGKTVMTAHDALEHFSEVFSIKPSEFIKFE